MNEAGLETEEKVRVLFGLSADLCFELIGCQSCLKMGVSLQQKYLLLILWSLFMCAYCSFS